MAGYFGIRDIKDDETEEQILNRIKNKDTIEVQYAKSVKLPDGAQMECPVGYAIVRIAPKASSEFNAKSKVTFFLNCQGHHVVGQRGVPVLLHEKFLSVLNLAVESQYTQREGRDPTTGLQYPMEEHKVFSEEFSVLYHNPDLEEAKRVEDELKANSAEFMKQKRAAKAARAGLIDLLNDRI